MQAAVSPPPDAMPVRLVSRLTNEFHVSGTVAVVALECGSFDAAIVLLLILRMSLPDWTDEDGVRVPPVSSYFASIGTLARSLARPRETVRRHVAALAARGLVVQDDRGVSLAGTAPGAERIRTYCLATHDMLVRLIADIAAAGALPYPSPMPARAVPRAALFATALDLHLMPFELFRDRIGDWTSMLIWGTISTANTRGVALDPVLTRRYAIDPTPDAYRDPVSLHAVARLVGVPYATAWRHATRLVEAGLLARCDAGWLVTRRELHQPEIEEATHATVRHYLRRIDRLHAQGLDLARVGQLYLAGRPPLVEFGDR